MGRLEALGHLATREVRMVLKLFRQQHAGKRRVIIARLQEYIRMLERQQVARREGPKEHQRT